MNTSAESETIAAIATPSGEGGIGVIRLSGPTVPEVISDNIRGDPEDLTPRKATLKELSLSENDDVLDRSLLTFFPAPNSFTGEPVLEISCHGSPLLLQTLLEDFIENESVRMADPGEFTRRAFENEKLDLAQADAVASLISARSEAALKSSARQLEGELSEVLSELRETLIYCQSRIEAGLDFGDQDSVGTIPYDELRDELQPLLDRIDNLIRDGKRGKLLQQGCRTVIAGRPNVGKSSVLNRLLKSQRAIVTDQPGTTRDVITDQIELQGIPFQLHDTAGIRSDPDTIEAKGVNRTEEALSEADLVVFLIDSSRELNDDDRAIYDQFNGTPHLLVSNKNDLDAQIGADEVERIFDKTPDCSISAKTGDGLDSLKQLMVESVTHDDVSVENPLVTQTRHLKALKSAQTALDRAIDGIKTRMDPSLIAEDLREASDAIARITGAISTDEILDRIFSSFCIGK